MLLAFLGDISGRRRRRREQDLAEERLAALLDRKGVLDVDSELTARLGVGRKALMRALYSLALREALHMLSNAKNELRVMSNAEFARFMTVRSGVGGAGERTQETADAAVEAAGIPLPLGEMESGLFIGATLGGAPRHPGYDWFAIDVAPPEAENAAGEGMPEGGKILPDREREPWVNCQGVGLD